MKAQRKAQGKAQGKFTGEAAADDCLPDTLFCFLAWCSPLHISFSWCDNKHLSRQFICVIAPFLLTRSETLDQAIYKHPPETPVRLAPHTTFVYAVLRICNITLLLTT